MPKKIRNYLDEKVMRSSFKPTKDQAIGLLRYVLAEDRNNRTVVPRYFIGKEKEMLKILADMGIKAKIYLRDGELYVIKEEVQDDK